MDNQGLVAAWLMASNGNQVRVRDSAHSSPANSRHPDQHFRWSEAGWWAWEDLNLRPHPYQVGVVIAEATQPLTLVVPELDAAQGEATSA